MLFLYSAGLMVSMGLFLGTLIVVFARVFEIKEDPRVNQVEEILPSYNCGVCGYPGCRHYAEAVVLQNAPRNKCRPGGKDVAEQINLILEPAPNPSPSN